MTVREQYVQELTRAGFAQFTEQNFEPRLAYLKRQFAFLLIAYDLETSEYLVTKFYCIGGDFAGCPLFEGSREECDRYFDDYLRRQSG